MLDLKELYWAAGFLGCRGHVLVAVGLYGGDRCRKCAAEDMAATYTRKKVKKLEALLAQMPL